MPHRYAIMLLLGLCGSLLLHIALVWPVHYLPLVKLTGRRPITVRLVLREQASAAQARVPTQSEAVQAPVAPLPTVAPLSKPASPQSQSRPRHQRAPVKATPPVVAKQPSASAQSSDLAPSPAPAEDLAVEAGAAVSTGAGELAEHPVVDLSTAPVDHLAPYDALVLAQIRQHQYYPRAARTRRLEGRVLLFVSIAQDGTVQAAEVRETSGYQLLDQAALAIIADSAPFPAPQLYQYAARRYLLPITFRISADN